MILQATHTHLYPGHSGKISGLARLADMQSRCDCLVAFSDGSAASATISRSADGWQLHTDAYRTAAGTNIADKNWRVHLQEEDDQVKFRILDKA